MVLEISSAIAGHDSSLSEYNANLHQKSIRLVLGVPVEIHSSSVIKPDADSCDAAFAAAGQNAHAVASPTERVENIPAELRALPQWVVWRRVVRDGKTTKPPYRSSDPSLKASVTDPSTWSTFDEAVACQRASPGTVAGIGFVFARGGGYFGIDIDDEGKVAPEHREQRCSLVDALFAGRPTYTELSPSGNGLHLIARGHLAAPMKNSAIGVEVYSQDRYFTVTGNVLSGREEITDRQDLADAFVAVRLVPAQAAAELADEPLHRCMVRSDEEVLAALPSAALAAYRGEAECGPGKWSEIFFGSVGALDRLTGSTAQVRRLVMASPMVQDAASSGSGEIRPAKAARLFDSVLARVRPENTRQLFFVKHGRQQWENMERTKAKHAETAAATSAAGLPIVSAASFVNRAVQPLEWVVDGIVPLGQVTAMYGAGASGKSLVAAHIGVGVAADSAVLGKAVMAGPVLFVSAEDDLHEVHRRLIAITAGEGISFDKLGQLHVLDRAGANAILAEPDGRGGRLRTTPLWDGMLAWMAKVRPRLLILDNLANVFAGNEIDRGQVTQFITALRGAAIKYDMAVLLLCHPSLSGMSSGSGTSGSTAWENSVRSRLLLARVKEKGDVEPDPNLRTLTVKKANHGPVGAEMRLRWSAGRFKLDEPSGGRSHEEAGALADRVFMALLARHAEQGIKVSHKLGRNYAPKLFATAPDGAGITQYRFRDAMVRLLATGKLRSEEQGPPSKRRACLVAS